MKTKYLLSSLALMTALSCGTSTAATTLPPAAVGRAQEIVALPDGGWLMLDKQGLRLLDASGKERNKVSMRAKHLDARPHADGMLSVLTDADTQKTYAYVVDVKTGQLRLQTTMASPDFSLESLCLYRDAQQLDHVFLIGKEGLSEQWVMHNGSAQLVRKLALPPHSKHCRVDDLNQTLYLSVPESGVWAFTAEAETAAKLNPVAMPAPFGKLHGGASAISALPGGVAVLDASGKTLHLFSQKDEHHFQSVQVLNLPYSAAHVYARSVHGTSGKLDILLQDEKAKTWRANSANWKPAARSNTEVAVIEPIVQTDTVARHGDAADDPAIWVHPHDARLSRVLGTNKKQGLLVYDMQGKQTQLLESGRLNNVDVRQNILWGQQRFDIAMATQRDENSLVLYVINAQGDVAEAARFPTTLDKIYGFCLYQPRSGGLEAFVNDKDGTYQQFRITHNEQGFSSGLVRSFKLGSQPEGCVADDKTDRLFMGEEKRGIWVTSAKADQAADLQMVMPVGKQLVADVEGLAIYFGEQANYLLVSSQGDSSYLVLEAQAPYRLRGKFRIGMNLAKGIDGTSETDGLDVSAVNFGGEFSKGMLVVQDGYKRLPDGTQNFKYIPWTAIARAFKLQ
ncbi:phytase [Undibacterium sp. Ji49W]|uniref:phytase n=1 Tax=Undibacterium sp. Ji49W TaxID=3413040 RepID=UPI003BF0DEFC